MKRIYKGFASIIVLVVLFLPAVQRTLPKIPWVLLFILTLTYGLSLFLSTQIPIYRRLAIAYLAFVGLSYLIAGVFGLLPDNLFASAMWYSLVSPYPLLTLFKGVIFGRPFHISELPYAILPSGVDEPNWQFSTAVVVVSSIAIVAAFAMAKNKKAPYGIWLFLLVFSILEALAYVVAEFAQWGVHLDRGPHPPTETVLSVCWVASYAIAYLVTRRGVELR